MDLSDELSSSISTPFDDGTTVEGDGAAGPSSFSTDGVHALHPAAGTRHLTAYDSEFRCVRSDGLDVGNNLEAGSAVVLSSTFAAPPESTTTVDVVIPRWARSPT